MLNLYVGIFAVFFTNMIVGYYDANAYPAPGYYNPIPWCPIEVPEKKSVPKKKSLKICVNCERYF